MQDRPAGQTLCYLGSCSVFVILQASRESVTKLWEAFILALSLGNQETLV